MRNFISKLLPFLLILHTCVPLPAPAQTDVQMKAMMTIIGASSEEELDEQEVEGFLHYVSHPLEINLARRQHLLSSGLLSRYQVASLEDYRSRNGDVLSFTELAAVEGFGPEYVSALKPFISLRSNSLPGAIAGESPGTSQELIAKVAVKGGECQYGAKYKFLTGDRAGFSAASKYPSWSMNAFLHGRENLGTVVLGDYNLRFGQGLALWSGLSLSGFSSSSSFSRRPTGLSPSYSWAGTGTHRGLAADASFGRFTFTGFLSLPGLRKACEGKKGAVTVLPGASAGWFGRNGQVSITGYGSKAGGKLSSDFRWNWKGVDYFGEAAYDCSDGALGMVAGTSVPIREDWRISSVIRRYPSGFNPEYSGAVRSWTKDSDELGMALGVERYGIQMTADLAAKDSDFSRKQCKLFLKVPVQLSGTTLLTLRITERYRTYEEYLKYRTGARLDLDWCGTGISARYGESDGDAWKARFRLEGLLCRSLAGLTYLEFGRKTSVYSAYLRGTVFIVDNWDDRIYSYERDAPGSFNVPAYYGRGYSLAAVGGGRLRFGNIKKKTLKAYFRVSAVSYPFMSEPKPAKLEAKLQLMASL